MELNELSNDQLQIVVAGDRVTVNKTDSVKDTLKRILSEKGITSFTILVNGVEVTSTAMLPDFFGDSVVEVQRYVKPGKS